MPAYASIEAPSISLGRTSIPVHVYRYQSSGSPAYESLDNIRVLGIRYREGPDPGMARFRYVFDIANPPTAPNSFQDALSVDNGLPGVVQNDDRLVVTVENPDGSETILFDGFAQVPELALAPAQELVSFVAFGVAVRAWDTPIGGALMRHADKPTTVSDVATDVVTHFNPRGQPNATPQGADALDQFQNTFPTFLDPLVIRSPDQRRFWTLPMAVRYLCYRHNAAQTYVQNPDGSRIDALLDSRSPISGLPFLPSISSDYTSQPILVGDYPASGKPWPVALHDLLAPEGFSMAFRLDTDGSGNPYTYLDIFRKDDASSAAYADLYLQLAGSQLDPAQSNLSQAHLARDTSSVANTIAVESELVRYEVSFVLAPGFPITGGDASNANSLRAFDKSDPSFSMTNRDKYRLYVLDETGEGHWDFSKSTVVYTVPSLATLLGGPNNDPSLYVKRRRIPLAELFSVDANYKPLKARLAISTNYSVTQPGIWDGSGTWQTIVGGFDLLRDRLGIWVNVANPNGWNIGPSNIAGAPYPAGVVKGVEDQAITTSTHFALRLTCVIEGDQILPATATRRPSSSTSFAVTRRIDARDRYFKHIVAAKSEFNTTSSPVVVRDDTSNAQSEAYARRLMSEAGEVAGSVTIPRFSNSYRIGNRIRSIQGRNLSLRTNAGAPTVEGEVYPAVVGLAWEFEGAQRTTLFLSDQRSEAR